MKKRNLYLVVGIAILQTLAIAKADACAAANSNVLSVSKEEAQVDTTMSLQEVTVRAHFARKNETPLNLITITPADIRRHATASNYLEMMQGNPGIYATASTGSYGDASLNMRGFKQDNIAILLNGIPIQGLTSGSMYWNNWMGLADATYAVQIQKGLGASMLADCAMGGMVNIITKNNNALPHTEFGVSTTSWGTTKGIFSHSTGLMKNGWGVDVNLSYVNGAGYVQRTNVETFSYMLSVSKILDECNSIIFTALGSPETHEQRNTELTAEEVDTYGREYSKNWGLLNGKPYSIGRNHYIKPYFTLQHIMEGERLSMKNSIYLAIADGGGRSTYAASGAKSIIAHQTPDGHIDFDAIVKENKENGASQNMMIDYLSGHTQAGAIVSGDYKINSQWTASAGLQYQYYDTWSEMKVLDLLGGEYWYDYATKAQLKVGDYVGARYGRTTHHGSGYLQARYTDSAINANLGVSIFSGNYRRHNDVTGEKSDWAHGMGASVKGGVLWHANKYNDLYLNAGYNSRLPYAGVYLASSDLSITNDITNEKNIMAELGWRPRWQGGGAEISAYIASWRNKTLTVSIAKRANEAAEKYQVKGLNALHKGVEMNVWQQFTPWLKASAYAMVASWKWQNSGNAIIYDSFSGETQKEYTIKCDGLHVGDAPQTQVGASLDAKIHGGFSVHLGWQHNARMYADFEPSSRNASDEADAYKLPAYNLMDATISWEDAITKDVRLNIFATATNIFDEKYIERGIDGKNHDLNTFKGYWGQARTVSLGFRIVM